MSARRRRTAKAGPPGFVRIIGGAHRGQRLPVAPITGLRPSPDRLRETLFNWIGQAAQGARCLDLFAGTGVLGFEALSRGASSATLVESDPQVVAALKAASERLALGGVTIHAADVRAWLASSHESFDIVFMDPPYLVGGYEDLCRALDKQGLLAANARVFVETPVEYGELDLPDNWRLHRSTDVGTARGLLYRIETSV